MYSLTNASSYIKGKNKMKAETEQIDKLGTLLNRRSAEEK